MNGRVWVNMCRYLVEEMFGEIGKEYIREAEHQDGVDYWKKFSDVEGVIEDVQRYRDSR